MRIWTTAGLLPKLVRDGFTGRIYCTQATTELAKIILLDSAKIQEEDTEDIKKMIDRLIKIFINGDW
jgi:Cft2 family RNA processing exonuclease